MLKRNRAFVAKIIFFIFVYYSVTYLIGQNAHYEDVVKQESQVGDDVDVNVEESEPRHPKINEEPLQPAPELKKEFFDKIDHLYDSEEAIKKDDEHVAEIPPKIDFEENEKVEKRDEGDDKSTENLDDQVNDVNEISQ